MLGHTEEDEKGGAGKGIVTILAVVAQNDKHGVLHGDEGEEEQAACAAGA